MAKGVQFRGIPQILTAFQNMKLVKWCVKYDKNINAKYEGESETESNEMLSEFLKMLSSSGGSSVYTLCVYEDLKKGVKIKPSTEPDYSFNFTLFNMEEFPNPFIGARVSTNQQILDKLTAMEARMLKYETEGPEEEERVGGVLGMINGIVDDPRFKDKIIDRVFTLADDLFKKTPIVPISPNRNLGAVGSVTEESPILIDESQHVKLQSAIDTLIRIDPALGDNLLKIAESAKNNPSKYKGMISMLNSFL